MPNAAPCRRDRRATPAVRTCARGGPAPRAELRVWHDAACRTVHDATCRVLAETGVEVRHPRALELLRQAGADVADTRARLPRELVDQAVAAAPRSLRAEAAGRPTAASIASSPTAAPGSAPAPTASMSPTPSATAGAAPGWPTSSATRPGEALPNIDFVMSMGLPDDADIERVDLAQLAAMLAGTRKPIVVSSPFGGAPLRVMVEMAAACGAAGSLACLTMSSPPLQLDEVCLDKLLVCGELGVPAVLAPSPSAGSTAPASIAAVVVVANAEVLAGLVVQPARPPRRAVPVRRRRRRAQHAHDGRAVPVAGRGARQSGLHRPGPLVRPAELGLRRRLRQQARSTSRRPPKRPWAPSSASSAGPRCSTTWATSSRACRAPTSTSCSATSCVGYARAFGEELPVDDEALALDEIMLAGPGGNHLARPLTRADYRAFRQSALLDQSAYERWQAEGATTLKQRVARRTRELLAEPADLHTRQRPRRRATRRGAVRQVHCARQLQPKGACTMLPRTLCPDLRRLVMSLNRRRSSAALGVVAVARRGSRPSGRLELERPPRGAVERLARRAHRPAAEPRQPEPVHRVSRDSTTRSGT